MPPPQQENDKKNTRLPSHVILATDNHEAGCETTARIWAKHKSELTGDAAYDSTISRVPVGQCHLCFVDCRSSMRVVAEGNATKAILYLPQTGSMDIRAGKKKFSAVPGSSVFIPAKQPVEFFATPIRCIMLEIPARKLDAELSIWGQIDTQIPPFYLAPDSADALSLTELLRFAVTDIERLGKSSPPDLHLHRLESHIVALLARAIMNHFSSHLAQEPHIGRLPISAMNAWIASRLELKIEIAELAALAGITQRALQKAFLRYFHTSPLAHIRNLRFQAAHKALRDSSTRKNITEIAMQFQFLHLGRFASDYQKQFGETPSQTLLKRKP